MARIRVRLADWRDREAIVPLRRLVSPGIEGGIFELLNLPMYHVHTAVVDGWTVGYSAVCLLPHGVADGVGTAVHETYRRQRIASLLRATQVRDLVEMGFKTLFDAVPQHATPGVTLFTQQFGQPLGIIACPGHAPMLYFGDRLETIRERLTESPYPLSPDKLDSLVAKTEAAQRDLSKLSALSQVEAEKARYRMELNGG